MKKPIRNSTAELLIITSQAEDGSIEVRVEDETVWLTQKLMAELFGVDVRTISEHLKNIFQSNELNDDSVIRKFRINAADGKKYLTQFYNLDAIISVGYRAKSHTATRFRQWATARLKEYLIRGIVLDDDRLKNPDKHENILYAHWFAVPLGIKGYLFPAFSNRFWLGVEQYYAL